MQRLAKPLRPTPSPLAQRTHRSTSTTNRSPPRRHRDESNNKKTNWLADKAGSRSVLRTAVTDQENLYLARTYPQRSRRSCQQTLPKRIEEYLRGPAFEQEAEAFLNTTIDNFLAKPLNELIGQFEGEKFEELKDQVTSRLLEVVRSEGLGSSISTYLTEAIDRLQPQTLGQCWSK